MRKVLSFVLVFSLVLGSFGMAFATTPSDVAGKDCEDAVAVLTDLGIVKGYEDGTYKPEGIVTRAEMAVLVVNALGLQDYVTSTAKSTFKDMAGYGWAEGFVAYAQSLGVISGYGDGTYKPGKTVSYDEAATMMVAGLGYNAECLQGTWPANFVTKAKALGILDDVKAGAAGANRGDVATMLFQTLDQAIGRVNNDGDWVGDAIEFRANGTAMTFDTMLNRLGAEIYDAGSAIVDADDDSFVLTESIADDAAANVRPYVGALVSAYANDDGDIIAIKEVFSTFVTGTYDADDEVFEATVADYDYSLNESKAQAFFYNGEAVGTSNSEYIIKPIELKADVEYTLAVDLSGKKIKEVYSIMYWGVTDAAQVDADDIADIKDDNALLGVDFPEDDNDVIDTTAFELYGVNTLADIEKDDVVYVYEGKDDCIARVAVGNKEVSGEATKVSSDNEEITIDGVKYTYAIDELNGDVDDADDNGTIEAGDEVKLTLDAYGYIYAIEEISGGADNYAIALEAGDGSGSIGADKELKLFLNDGTDKVFDVDGDALADFETSKDASGINYDTMLVATATTWNADLSGLLVKYGVDKDGVIDTLDNIGEDDYTFMRATAKSAISAKGYYDGYKINSDAVIYSADFASNLVSTDEEDDYTATTLEKVLDSDDVIADYILDDGKIAAMLIYDYSISDDVYGVATDKASNNSDAGFEIDFFINGKTVTYNADENDAYKLVNSNPNTDATLWKLSFDSNGDVKKVVTAFNEDDTYAQVKIDVTSNEAVSYSGHVLTLEDATKVITSDAEKVTFTTNGNRLTIDNNVVIYVEDDGDWTIGGTSDLKDLGGRIAVFYDIDGDEDKVMDTVLIY